MVTCIQKGHYSNLEYSKMSNSICQWFEALTYPDCLKALGLPTLKYRRDRADMNQVNKILNNIDNIDKDSLFTMSAYPSKTAFAAAFQVETN